MKSLVIAVALVASWLALNAEGSETPWDGAGHENYSSHRSAGRADHAEAKFVMRDEKGNIRCKAVYAPVPIYPKIAPQVRNEGRGLFVLSLRPNGTVSGVVIERSTGYRELDAAAMEALTRWRFQAKAGVTQVHIPISFFTRRF
jgi:TonB family protein